MKGDTMQIKLNGEMKELVEGMTLAQLLTQLELKGPLAVELNGDLVEEDEFARQVLSGGDVVEVLRFVGGG